MKQVMIIWLHRYKYSIYSIYINLILIIGQHDNTVVQYYLF